MEWDHQMPGQPFKLQLLSGDGGGHVLLCGKEDVGNIGSISRTPSTSGVPMRSC
jgi:hypothetical protein